MSYTRLSSKQQRIVDFIFTPGNVQGRHLIENLAAEFRIKPRTVKQFLRTIYMRYQIFDHSRYFCYVRLMYLRAKELGMLAHGL